MKNIQISRWPIILLFFLRILSYSITILPTQQWMLEYVCQEQLDSGIMLNYTNASNASLIIPVKSPATFTECRRVPSVQASTARWEMLANIGSNAPSILTLPILGALSDRIGRKPILLIPISTGLLNIGALLWIIYFKSTLWILVGMRILIGFMGSWFVLSTVVHAYLSDITSPSQRTITFIFAESAIYISYSIGPPLGGLLGHFYDIKTVLWISMALCLFTLVYVWFLVEPRNILPELKDKTSTQNSFNSIIKDSLSCIYKLFFTKGSIGKFLVLFVIFAVGIAMGATSVFFLWTAYKFEWDALITGTCLFVYSMAKVFYICLVYPLLEMLFKRLKMDNISFQIAILQTSTISMVVTFIMLALATKGWHVFTISLIDGYGALATPTLKGLLSMTIAPDLQGTLFSGMAMLQQLGTVIATLVFPNIWAGTVGTEWTDLFLYIQAIIILIGFFCTLFLSPNRIQIYTPKGIKMREEVEVEVSGETKI